MSARETKKTKAASARSRKKELTPAHLAAQKWFNSTGTTVASWARERGFSVNLVSMVLTGARQPRRGQSHAIAVALGIKQGVDAKAVPLGGKP
jgi:gp16 family phage-associated protein